MNKEVAHEERAHSPVGPSSLKRVLNCPVSVPLSKGFEDTSGASAKLGTHLHELCEIYLESLLEKGKFPKVDFTLYSKDDRNLARAYSLFCHEVISPYLDDDEDRYFYSIEERLDLDKAIGQFGSSDFVFGYMDFEDYWHAITVDLKTGRVPVPVEENVQLAGYFYGIKETYPQYDFQTYTGYIYQPSEMDNELDDDDDLI